MLEKFSKNRTLLERITLHIWRSKFYRDYFKTENTNGVLLLSPSYPSFDQFKNYGHRGDTFKKLAKEKLT